MRKITDSFVFNQLLKNENIKNSIRNLNITRDRIERAAIDEQLSIIAKKMRFAGKDVVVDLLSNDKIVPLYNPNLSLPKYLNSFLKLNQSGMPVAMVDLTNFSRITADDVSDIYPKTLFALLQNGAIAYELNANWNRYTTNINIVKNSSIIYSKLLGKVLDKLYAIKTDNFKSDLVHFLLAKFFLINLCDRLATDNTDRIAYMSCFNDSTYDLIVAEADSLGTDCFKSLDLFIMALSKLGMKSLNIRLFIENFARMYGETTLLALDYLPAFFGVVFSVAINGNLAKDYIIEGLCGKQIELLYPEFFKLAR